MRHTTPRLLLLPPTLSLTAAAFAQQGGAPPRPDLGRAMAEGIGSALPTLFITLWPMWAMLAALYLLKYAASHWEKKRLLRSGIGQIDAMGGQTFEKYLEALFEKQGYRVERTAYVGDWGADLILGKDGVRTIVQAKRYTKKVGVRAVQEAVAAKGKYGCTEAVVVTNSRYTAQAVELARANKVVLRDRDWLVQALLTLNAQTPPATTAPAASAPAGEPAAAPVVYTEDERSDTCVVCGQPVSAAVRAYCLADARRFKGRVFCYVHQKKRFVDE